MSPRSLLLIAAALLLTVGTVMVARGWLQNQRSQVVSELGSDVRRRTIQTWQR